MLGILLVILALFFLAGVIVYWVIKIAVYLIEDIISAVVDGDLWHLALGIVAVYFLGLIFCWW